MADTNPLDAFSGTGGSAPIRLAPLPSLSELMAQSGYKEGAKQFDNAMAEWARNLERSINEYVSKSQPVPTGKLG